jgi:regulator of sirC expression with transglutaminase-like and TPR domain
MASTSKPTEETPASKPTVPPFFRVIISRLTNSQKWQIISNPRWDYATKAQSAILHNESNDYTEYSNCGVIYRMVRKQDLHRYMDDQEFDPAWALDPREAI